MVDADLVYRELQPSAALAPFVECFWTTGIEKNCSKTILPDGCVDALFSIHNGRAVQAQVVGAMTFPHKVALRGNQRILGIRFQPGMAGICLPVDLSTLTDKTIPLQRCLGVTADEVLRFLNKSISFENAVAEIDRHFTSLPGISPFHEAIGELVGKRGQMTVDDIAGVAGVSERQLQRTCLKNAGLTPKRLARILRFRQVTRLLVQDQIDHACVAVDCGFSDQSHMVREFREFAGVTPTQFVKYRSR